MASLYQTTANLFSEIRDIVTKDSTTLPDATLLRFANKRYLEMVRQLVSLNEDLYAEVSSADLVSGQREYVLPTDNTSSTYGGGLIKLQRVEISYDAGSNWYLASPMSLQEFSEPTVTDADLNSQTSKTSPKYWFKDRSVWLAPVPSATDSTSGGNAGLRMYWIKRPNEIAATTDIPEIPKDFLGLLGEGILIDVFRMFDRTADSRDSKANWTEGLAIMKNLEAGPDAEQPFIFMAARKNYK